MEDVVPWDNPEAGNTYNFTLRSECVEKLRLLKSSGVRVPESAILALLEEIDTEGDTYT